MSAVSCAAWIALRIRVRKSAMGSVMDMGLSALRVLPAGLGHPGDEPVVGQLPQADPADAELAVDGARAPAAAAPTVLAGLVLGGAGGGGPPLGVWAGGPARRPPGGGGGGGPRGGPRPPPPRPPPGGA